MSLAQPSSAVQAQFAERGYYILKGVLDEKTLAGARAAMNTLVDRLAAKLVAGGQITDTLDDAPFETRLALLYSGCPELAPKSFRSELHLAGLYPLFFSPELLDFVETFLGGEIRLYPNYTARPKLPERDETRVLWHQDGGYTESVVPDQQVDSLRMINVWAPLVPARVQNGCMQFVPGTHRLGSVPHVRREHYLEIDEAHLSPHLDQAIPIELDPGDIVCFHNLLFHQGLPNHASTVRWSLDWRYQDATQPTLRKERGHIARSRLHPERAVKSAEQWANLSFT